MVMMFVAKGLNAVPGYLIKFVIDDIVNQKMAFHFIFLYCGFRQVGDLINKWRDVIWAPVAANCEVYVEDIIFRHLQKQSMSFHVSRETGKIIAICSKGSTHFSQVLRLIMFLYLPLLLEVGFICLMIFYAFPPIFFYFQIASVVFYVVSVTVAAEWRHKLFEKEADKSNQYTQKATDTLMNYETVNYFNAHDHERKRFLGALSEYEEATVNVSFSLAIINIIHSIIISLGLFFNIALSVRMYLDDELTIGDVVMLNTYILQIYAPMFYLGTYYRNMRKALTGVEQIFGILSVDQTIKEPVHPVPCRINKGEIEFENVTFSYSGK